MEFIHDITHYHLFEAPGVFVVSLGRVQDFVRGTGYRVQVSVTVVDVVSGKWNN